MNKEYKQLGIEERCAIAVGLEQGLSRRAIGRLLKRPHCTIGREIDRNAIKKNRVHPYTPREAQWCCEKRKSHPAKKLSTSPELWEVVQALMKKSWSPEQASGMLKRMYPDDPDKQVSHETIYAHIYAYPRGGLRTDLINLLRSRTRPVNHAPAAKTGGASCWTSRLSLIVRRMLRPASCRAIGKVISSRENIIAHPSAHSSSAHRATLFLCNLMMPRRQRCTKASCAR